METKPCSSLIFTKIKKSISRIFKNFTDGNQKQEISDLELYLSNSQSIAELESRERQWLRNRKDTNFSHINYNQL